MYTHFHNAITTWDRIITKNSSYCQAFKVINYFIWMFIKHIVTKYNLLVSLTKVKSHSNDTFNDIADQLAAQGKRKLHTQY